MKRMNLLTALCAAMLMIAATSCTKEELVQPDILRSAMEEPQDEFDPPCVFPLEPQDDATSATVLIGTQE